MTNEVIILRLLHGSVANDVTDISSLSHVDKVTANAEPNKYVPLAIERQRWLASAFRDHMTKGQTYHTTNSNRKTFYTDVMNTTGEVIFFPSLLLSE
jgi:hypothetical protein